MGFKNIFSKTFWNGSDFRASTSNNWLSSGMWESNKNTKSGVSITKENAQAIPAVYSAVKIYADSLSSLPIDVIKQSGKNQTKETTHPIYSLLNKEPNSLMTSFVYRQIVIPQVLLWGNSYSLIEFEKGGRRRPKALLPIAPNRVKVTQDGGILYYEISVQDGRTITVDQSNILHYRGLGNDVQGKSVIDYAANNLGLGKAAEDFGGLFFGNGANMNGVLSTDNKLSAPAIANLRQSLSDRHQGLTNSNKMLILEEGLKFNSTSIPPDAAQFLQTREFSVIDIARWFNLPPHKLKDLTRATFSNIEEQSLDFVKESLIPMATMMEQENDRKLLRVSEKSNTYTKFNMNALLRGDIKTRYEAHKVGIQNGFITPNEARIIEGMNPIDGLDTTWMQLNTAPVVDGTNQQATESEEVIEVEDNEDNITT